MVLHRPVELAALIGTYAITSGLPTTRPEECDEEFTIPVKEAGVLSLG
jgi:hypothetical protein